MIDMITVSWINLLGFFLLSAAEYLILAPIYWVLLILNLKKTKA